MRNALLSSQHTNAKATNRSQQGASRLNVWQRSPSSMRSNLQVYSRLTVQSVPFVDLRGFSLHSALETFPSIRSSSEDVCVMETCFIMSGTPLTSGRKKVVRISRCKNGQSIMNISSSYVATAIGSAFLCHHAVMMF